MRSGKRLGKGSGPIGCVARSRSPLYVVALLLSFLSDGFGALAAMIAGDDF